MTSRLEALNRMKLVLDERIDERLKHYQEVLAGGKASPEALAEIADFLIAIMPEKPAKEPSHEPRHWKRGAVDRLDANPNTRVEFQDNP